MSRKLKVVVHPRPFLLFYGESPRTTYDIANYHARSRCGSITGAMCAAIRRLHRLGGVQRADIYDVAGMYYGNIRVVDKGYDISLSTWAWDMHFAELKKNKGVVNAY